MVTMVTMALLLNSGLRFLQFTGGPEEEGGGCPGSPSGRAKLPLQHRVLRGVLGFAALGFAALRFAALPAGGDLVSAE